MRRLHLLAIKIVLCSVVFWKATAGEGEAKWIIPLGPAESFSPPASGVNSPIYVLTGREGNSLCYSITPQGETNWTRQLPGGWANTSPTVLGDGTVLAVTRKHLFALAPDGAVKWSIAFWGDVVGYLVIGPDGSIYFFIHDPESPELWSISRRGKFNWKQQVPANTDFTSLAVGADGTIYVTSPGWIAAIMAESGLLKDIRPMPSIQGTSFSGWLALPNNMLMFSGIIFSPELGILYRPRFGAEVFDYNGFRCAVDAWGNIFGGIIGSWGTSYGLIKSRPGHGISSFPELLWRTSEGGNWGIALSNDGSVVTVLPPGLVCLNSLGQSKWSFFPPPRPNLITSEASGPIITSDGTIYFSYSLTESPNFKTAYLAAVEGPPINRRRTWSQERGDLRRSGRLAGPSVDVLIDSVRRLSDGTAEVVVIGEPDQTYGVEYTDDLVTWFSLGEGTSANGCFRLLDPGAKGRPTRFYRMKHPNLP